MSTLAGKTAFVTGGSRGIGAAIVRRLAEEGAQVAFTYATRRTDADALARELTNDRRRCLAIEADSADPNALPDAINHAADELQRLDILVNSAGIFPYGSFEKHSLEEVDRAIAVHTRAVLLAAQAASPHLTRGGRIVSIGSSLAERAPYEGVALYSMTKSALTGLTKGLARDLGPRGITVNLVHPGSTDTEMNPAEGPQAEEESALTAIGRYCRPEEIAAAVAFLATEAAAGITGTAITVDGGVTA